MQDMNTPTESQRPRYKMWMLHLVPAIPYGKFWCCLLLFALLNALFFAMAGMSLYTFISSLFFCAIIAYIVPIFAYITERTMEALDEIYPLLDMDLEEFDALKHSVNHKSVRWIALCLLGGFLGSVLHYSVVRGGMGQYLLMREWHITEVTGMIGSLMVWITMTTAIAALVYNAVVFARLGATRVRIQLLQTRQLVVVGKVAVISTLALIGALMFFPLLFLNQSISFAAISPATLATAVPMIMLFFLPIWPVHQRIRKLKQRELERIEARISPLAGAGDSPLNGGAELQQLLPLLAYQREISSVSSWPFDLGVLTRLGLYMVIPPLTWLGAALLEKLLDLYL
jgi:hypothetical protein